jgi:DUF4097 and DUF4098 domain-containing protein YvlB
MTTWEFPCPGPATISVSSWASGNVAISGEQTSVISVEVTASRPGADISDMLDEIRVAFEDGRLLVKGPKMTGSFLRRKSLDLTIKAPAGSDCEVATASADVSCVGQLGELTVTTASGDVTLTSASGPVTIRTASGDVFADRASDVRVDTASGDVQVAHADGETRVKTVSGDVSIADIHGPVSADTVSGDLDIRELSGGHASVNSMSGDVHLTVRTGISVYLNLSSTSGDVRSDLDEVDGEGDAGPGATLEIKCRTISGDIRVAKGQSAAA